MASRADKARERSKEEIDRIMVDLKEQEEELKRKYKEMHDTNEAHMDKAGKGFDRTAKNLRNGIAMSLGKLS